MSSLPAIMLLLVLAGVLAREAWLHRPRKPTATVVPFEESVSPEFIAMIERLVNPPATKAPTVRVPAPFFIS